jgi:sugar phosphate isomerase/epimerase
MKIGISRAMPATESVTEMLASANKHGFQGVQLKQGQYAAHLEAPGGFRKEHGDWAALSCGGLVAYPGGDASVWPEKLKPIVTFASAVQAGHVCVCTTVARGEGAHARVARTLNAIGADAARQGVSVSLHNHLGGLFENEGDFEILAGMFDVASAGFTIDTGHTAKAGIADAGALVRRYARLLRNVHLKDMDAQGHFCPLGRGGVDLHCVLKALRDVAYDGWLVVDEETHGMPTEEAFSIAAAYLRNKGLL